MHDEQPESMLCDACDECMISECVCHTHGPDPDEQQETLYQFYKEMMLD